MHVPSLISNQNLQQSKIPFILEISLKHSAHRTFIHNCHTNDTAFSTFLRYCPTTKTGAIIDNIVDHRINLREFQSVPKLARTTSVSSSQRTAIRFKLRQCQRCIEIPSTATPAIEGISITPPSFTKRGADSCILTYRRNNVSNIYLYLCFYCESIFHIYTD